MISVVICDDEVLARAGMQSLLEPCADIHIAGVFGSGREALTFLRKRSVDIVITDVEMAGMNGLRLIELLQAECLTKGIIIVSAHDNFEYVRKAMHMGTHRYILKQELNGEVLVETIRQLYRKLPQKKQIMPLTAQREPTDQEKRKYVMGVLSFHSEQEPIDGDDGMLQYDEGIIYGLLEDLLQNMQMGTLYRSLNKKPFVLFSFPEHTEETVCRRKAETYAHALSRTISQYAELQTVLGLSGVFADRGELSDRYKPARNAGELYFWHQERNWFWQEETCEQVPELPLTADCYLTKDGMENTMEILATYLQQCAQQNVSVRLLRKYLLNKLNMFLYEVFGKYGYGEERSGKSGHRSQLSTVVTESDSSRKMLAQLRHVLVDIGNDLGKTARVDKMESILRYIDAHITEKMALNEVAQESCMSVSSFCNFFKEQTGYTFIQYVNNLRIQRVKEALKQSDLTIDQIAEMTGYANANYLIRVFKKTTGITISDYRRSLKKRKTEEDFE